MGARAEATQETARRIRAAMWALFVELPFPQITLAMVGERAGVTLQTVLRHFGTKGGLMAACAAEGFEQVAAQRDAAPADDVPAAVKNLCDHYEQWGAVSLRLLDQEHVPEIGAFTHEGRALHVAWVERVFAGALKRRRGSARARLVAQLVAVTDVYVWKILRRDRGLGKTATERALAELVDGICAHDGGP